MSKAIAKTGFDYDSVDKDTKGKLLAWVREFRAAAKDHAKSGLELGKIVAQAHEELAGEGRDGSFSEWVESELNVSRQTAYRYLWVYERFGKCNTVLHFFDQTALYKLAAPKVSEKAVAAAIKRADEGKSVTPEIADELIEKYADKPKAKPSTGSAKPAASEPAADDSPKAGAADLDDDDPNEHVRQQIRNEEATGDINKPAPPPEPEAPNWKGLLDLVGQVRRAADTCNKLSGRKGKFCEQFQDTCGILDDIVRDWRKVTK